jgi:hypothetical protein
MYEEGETIKNPFKALEAMHRYQVPIFTSLKLERMTCLFNPFSN